VWGLYAAAGRIAAPLAAPYLARRAARGKEDPARLGEKRGVPSRPAFPDPPVWLHAVSAGESVAALSLADRLIAARLPVLFTTATPTAAALVARAEGERLVHQYAPLDAPGFVGPFLDHWRPRAAIFTESEVWPTTLRTLARRAVVRALVNARLSERSFTRWRRLPWLSAPLFAGIDIVLAQSAVHAERFASLGARDVRVTGNMKFDAPPPVADAARLARLREAVGARPVWLAASTHPGEEIVVVEAQRRLARERADVLTLIAPRHPHRGGEVAALAASAGRVTRQSEGALPDGAVHVVDTFGDLGTFFALAPVVLVGGSLRPLGGHNPAEPAAHGAALLTGPDHGEMFAPFLAAGAASVVPDAAALAAAVERLMADDARRAAQAERAAAVLAAERGAVDRTVAALRPRLALAPAPGRAA
jgi:3-deoxy-D-manno-octulosonic-acid transferase